MQGTRYRTTFKALFLLHSRFLVYFSGTAIANSPGEGASSQVTLLLSFFFVYWEQMKGKPPTIRDYSKDALGLP